MDTRSLILNQSELQAKKQLQYVNQLFGYNPDLSDIFARIAEEKPELCQQILDKSEFSIKSWFLIPEGYMQAIQTLALLAPVFGPVPEPESLRKTWLLPTVRSCINGMEHAFDFDPEVASHKIATHLLRLNPDFTRCDSLKQTREHLQAMFTEQRLHWSLFINHTNSAL